MFDKLQFSFLQNAALIPKQIPVICLQNCTPYGRGMHLHGSIRGCRCQLDAWMATVDRHRHGNVEPPSLAVSSVDTGPLLCNVYCFRALLWCTPAPDECRPPVKCSRLDQACPRMLGTSEERNSQAASVCHFKHLRTPPWPERTWQTIVSSARGAALLIYNMCFGEQVNRVWSASLIQLICLKWANRIRQRDAAARRAEF